MSMKVVREKDFNEEGVCFLRSKMGRKIKILKIGWQLITEIKHQELKGKFREVVKTIKNPDEIRKQKQEKEIFLYHKKFGNKYLRVVCRHYNHEGFLITAHYCKKPKGEKL